MIFSFQNIFKLVLEETGLKASTVARDLHRERSLMYKWLSGSSTPASYYFPLIAKIVISHTSRARQMVLSGELLRFISNADLPPDIRKYLLRTDSIETLLTSCMDLSVTPDIREMEEHSSGPGAGTPLKILLWALFAALSGGLLWNLSNRILGWEYFMAGSEHNLRGFPAFFWGAITSLMIPLPLLFLHREKDSGKRLYLLLICSLIGGISAFLFYSSGFREFVLEQNLGYILQETILVVVFSFCLSGPVFLGAVFLMTRSPGTLRVLSLMFIPAGITLVSFLLTLIIKRPYLEVLQLRGFVVGFTLRITLFFLLFLSFETSGSRVD